MTMRNYIQALYTSIIYKQNDNEKLYTSKIIYRLYIQALCTSIIYKHYTSIIYKHYIQALYTSKMTMRNYKYQNKCNDT